MKTTLLIARHGNTFDKGDTVLRVGARTDLPLSASGQEQARLLGQYLATAHPRIDAFFTSRLQRTQQTAALAQQQLGSKLELRIDPIFDEIDYGPDEGKPETDVVARIGQDALDAWEFEAAPPPGWQVDPETIIQNWKNFAQTISHSYAGGTVLVVTSNGIARFAPYLLPDPQNFMQTHRIKLATGAVSCLTHSKEGWHVEYWNRRPKEWV